MHYGLILDVKEKIFLCLFSLNFDYNYRIHMCRFHVSLEWYKRVSEHTNT
jgi:hypothetical protein